MQLSAILLRVARLHLGNAGQALRVPALWRRGFKLCIFKTWPAGIVSPGCLTLPESNQYVFLHIKENAANNIDLKLLILHKLMHYHTLLTLEQGHVMLSE